MSQLELLWKLQNYDKKISTLNDKLEETKEGEEVQRFYLKLRQREYDSTNINTQIDVNKEKIHRNNKKLNELNYKLNDINEKLYSGEITDLEQLDFMNKESKKIKEDIEKIESEILALMEKVEVLKGDSIKIAEEQKTLDEELKLAEERQAERIREIEEKISKYKKKSSKVVEQLDESTVNSYKELKEAKGKNKAVVRVSDNRCTGCHMSVPLSLVSKLKKHEEIIHCDNCGRILYYSYDEK
ncbi:zinc ribbon domain-containing protein [Sporosalibacterium faouarense]|uniref:zinc ribbon domain-containing protein n=1 Tax=Sporosalibacterium faouarense TaxID=516123 RepID=UPI00192C1938|nr:C4-type zinc ribbon domain-containing protein [Sporosalibacterium faouarense]